MDIKKIYWKTCVCIVALLFIDFGCPELPWMIEECTVGVSYVNAATYMLGTPDAHNSMTEDGTVITNSNYCYFGVYLSKYYDAYFAFSIPDSIYSTVIDSVKIIGYSDKKNGTVYIYGIALEDCPDVETGDPHSWSRGSESVIWTGELSTGWHWLGDNEKVTNIFMEWVNSYNHEGTDQFGIVVDDNNANRSWISDYERVGNDNQCRIYIYYHYSKEINARNVLWSNGARNSLWSEGSSSVFEEQ